MRRLLPIASRMMFHWPSVDLTERPSARVLRRRSGSSTGASDSPTDDGRRSNHEHAHPAQNAEDGVDAAYIVGTRGKGEVSSGANHPGFRCVKDVR